jgi:lipopolysaccharide biosynthesis regulator YciM
MGGDWAGGIDSLNRLIASKKGKRSRKVIPVYRELASLHLQRDDLFEALDALVAAHELNRFDAQTATTLGMVAMDLDEYRVAEKAFRAVTLMKNREESRSRDGATPEDKSAAFYHLGKIAQIKGKTAQARMMVDKARAEEPENQRAKDLMVQLDAP